MAYANLVFNGGQTLAIELEAKTELFRALFRLTTNPLDETVCNAYQILIKMLLGEKDLAKNVRSQEPMILSKVQRNGSR
jgi:hypothetical protein